MHTWRKSFNSSQTHTETQSLYREIGFIISDNISVTSVEGPQWGQTQSFTLFLGGEGWRRQINMSGLSFKDQEILWILPLVPQFWECLGVELLGIGGEVSKDTPSCEFLRLEENLPWQVFVIATSISLSPFSYNLTMV